MKIEKEFKIVEGANDYIDEVITFKGSKICFVNCEDWFEQYPINKEEGEPFADPDYECGTEWYVPVKLLPDCDHYINVYEDRRGRKVYHGLALYSTTETYMEEFYDLGKCIAWLIADEDFGWS